MNIDNKITLLFADNFSTQENTDNIYSDELKEVLRDKDYSIVNLETPLTNGNQPIEKLGNNFKRNPQTIKHIKDGFFDAVTLSNNHIRDYDDEGVLDTLKTCNDQNIQTVGAGKNINDAAKPLRLNIKGKKISILNYSEKEFNIASEKQAGANPYDTITAFYDIQKEKQENDFVIVVYHGGLEYQYYPTPEMVRKFKFMVDAGADAVVSHHTHRYSGSMVYNSVPILFGLGNFLSPTKSKVTEEWLTGIIAKIKLEENSIDFELVPTKMALDFSQVDLVNKSKSAEVIEHINDISQKIRNENIFNKYWFNQDNKAKFRIFKLLKSNSPLEYKLKKYFSFVFKTHFSNHKKSLLLNMIRCDAHRNRLIRILENNFKK